MVVKQRNQRVQKGVKKKENETISIMNDIIICLSFCLIAYHKEADLSSVILLDA